MSMTDTAAATAGNPASRLFSGMRKADLAYHAVRRSILLGHLLPGSALLEQKIAEEMNCSQGTVREALLRLEQDGLVARRGYRGTMVSQTSVEEAVEMVRIRTQIECAGLRQSIGGFSSDTIATLFELTDQMEEGERAGDYYRCSEIDRQFHFTLFRQSGLDGLEPMLRRCTLHVHRFTLLNAEERPADDALAEDHRNLVRVFETRDAAGAQAAVRTHIERIIGRFAPSLSAAIDRIPDAS